LVIEWNVREEGCHVDDVRVGRNSEGLGDFSRDENGFIAFPQMTVVIIVVFVVIPPSVSESGALVRNDLRLTPGISLVAAKVFEFLVVCFIWGSVSFVFVAFAKFLLSLREPATLRCMNCR
jgi:hypothetical protein